MDGVVCLQSRSRLILPILVCQNIVKKTKVYRMYLLLSSSGRTEDACGRQPRNSMGSTQVRAARQILSLILFNLVVEIKVH